MVKTAVLYASGFTKNTEKIAKYIAKNSEGDSYDLKDITEIDLSMYQTVVFGTGIHAGKPYKQVVEFIGKNKGQLNGKDVKLFICCMYNGDKGSKQCSAVSKSLGIPDAVFFNKKEPEMNDKGFPKSVDDFIERL